MVELFRMSKGREFQMMGATTEKLRDPKPVRTRGTNNKLEPLAIVVLVSAAAGVSGLLYSTEYLEIAIEENHISGPC